MTITGAILKCELVRRTYTREGRTVKPSELRVICDTVEYLIEEGLLNAEPIKIEMPCPECDYLRRKKP